MAKDGRVNINGANIWGDTRGVVGEVYMTDGDVTGDRRCSNEHLREFCYIEREGTR